MPDDATIDSSHISFIFASYIGTPPECTMKAEDDDAPAQITGYEDGNSRALTTASISMTGPYIRQLGLAGPEFEF